jgi:hypothetical protein
MVLGRFPYPSEFDRGGYHNAPVHKWEAKGGSISECWVAVEMHVIVDINSEPDIFLRIETKVPARTKSRRRFEYTAPKDQARFVRPPMFTSRPTL